MKKILILLGTITLIGTSTTSLVTCNKTQEYTKKQLDALKKENQINTTDENIKNNLEWMAAQEKPFNKVDNKYYFVVWRANENNDWRIIKFKHSDLQKKVLDKYNEYELKMEEKDLLVYENKFPYRAWSWQLNISGRHFKLVYRWNLEDTNVPNLIINSKTGEIKVK